MQFIETRVTLPRTDRFLLSCLNPLFALFHGLLDCFGYLTVSVYEEVLFRGRVVVTGLDFCVLFLLVHVLLNIKVNTVNWIPTLSALDI